jgi:threonylcarbamoyladenosine tRNA methylthiotransferase MtaB
MPRLKVAITTLGCKVNRYESEHIIGALGDQHYEIVPFESRADFYVINTCSITAGADRDSKRKIRLAQRLNPDACLIVTGCYAQVAAAEIRQNFPVHYIVGTSEKHTIPDLIRNFQPSLSSPREIIGDPAEQLTYFDTPVQQFQQQTRAYIKIQDGCNRRCSYCIIPRARGQSRSLPLPAVMSRLEQLATAGYREIVITGINLSDYGRDLSPQSSLYELLAEIERNAPLVRIRLTSLEPSSCNDRLLAILHSSKKFCPHLHISLQSADPRVLKQMRRGLNLPRFQERLREYQAAIPNLFIGFDIIVGFSGEGEAEFENTANFLRNQTGIYLHVFPFSKRQGTEAASMPDQVDQETKKKRVAILRAIGEASRLAFYQRYIGTIQPVLFEAMDEKRGYLSGHTPNYIPVLVRSDLCPIERSALQNTEHNVLIERVEPPEVLGCLLPEAASNL